MKHNSIIWFGVEWGNSILIDFSNPNFQRKAEKLLNDARMEKSAFWALDFVLDGPSKRDLRDFKMAVILGKISSEQLKRVIQREKERRAIAVILWRMFDYEEKRETTFRLFQRTGLSSWFDKSIYYLRRRNELHQQLTKIYVERRRKLDDALKGLGRS